MDEETCKGCTEDRTPEPGPVLFSVKPYGAWRTTDSAWTCAVHLPKVIDAYGRMGYSTLVTPIRLRTH